MKIGIYESNECDNSVIQKPIDGILKIEISYLCAFCNKSHKFYLDKVVDE